MLMPKTPPAATPNVVGWSNQVRPVALPPSPAKRKHLGMMGTPVWCLPRALRCLSAFRRPGCSGRPSRVGYGITQQGQPLPGQVVAGSDVTRYRSGQAAAAADGTCVRKGSASRLTRVDVALRQDGEARAPIKPSVNGVWLVLVESDIRGALGTRGGSDRATRLVVGYSAPKLIIGALLILHIASEEIHPYRELPKTTEDFQTATSEISADYIREAQWVEHPTNCRGFRKDRQRRSSRRRLAEEGMCQRSTQSHRHASRLRRSRLERTASQASTSGREGSESSSSKGEPIKARQCPSGRSMRINDQRVYRRGDWEMMELANGCLVYTVDYFMSAITPRYLAALGEEFGVLLSVELLAPGANDLPSRPPPGYITLSAEYFRVGLRLPFQPFLSRDPIQGIPELIKDEVCPLVNGILLLPGFQGDIHHELPGFRQAIQASMVLRGWPVAAWGIAV
ncbi:hypothetical protein TIFTF001_032905 [Ficus carica]|uniref:Uncharacterized protein n=1 Tax=Ficus carica TaxID=3494 RepID=A0AA88E497_FICCA|nr:hypothetical protein TIFTF001_032905 [Ficus carica]